MASTAYAALGIHSNMCSRLSTENFSGGLNMHNLEIVGESDAQSQRTAEVCQDRMYSLSETASEDSCTMRESIGQDNFFNSSHAVLRSKPSLSTRIGRNHLRRQLKQQLAIVRSMISILESRETFLRIFSTIPELETNLSSSKSACGSVRKRREFLGDEDFLPAEERFVRSGKKSKGGMKRPLHSNADFPIPKLQKLESDSKKLSHLIRQCGTILKRLRTHKYSWVFNQPVDYVALDIPDYPLVIKHPMDLGTIKSKMDLHVYKSPLEFAADVRLTFANAMKFNPKGHEVHYMAEYLLRMFEERWEALEKKLNQLNLQEDYGMMVHREPVGTVVQGYNPAGSAGCSSVTTVSRNQRQLNVERQQRKPMTYEEKQVLSEMLEEVPMEKLGQVMEIIKRRDPNLKPVDGEVTIDIDCLDLDSFWELHDLLKHPEVATKAICRESNHNGGSAQPRSSPISIHQTSEDAKDEDVDIDDDVPATHFAPVCIDKDPAVCRSPSSSSSSNSSSSSDSSSGNSSSSDSEADDAQSSGSESKLYPGKEPEGSDAVCEPGSSPTLKLDDAKRPVSDLDEEVSISRSNIAHLEYAGSGDPNFQEPQIQEKLHRAALLRNRFADTILKAREKTFPSAKSNSSDPEKLKREREELERLQREERLRLQAEAKAAENVRKNAEAIVLEKARREREAQRQAARLVIQQMEKTVEIDESIEYLKNLELLGNAPFEARDFSPSLSREGSTILPFQSTSPLEQLGLFMKEDEEYEQDIIQPAQQEASSPRNPNEEGEIDDS